MKFDVRVRGLGGSLGEARVARLAETARQLASAPVPPPPVQPRPVLPSPAQPSTPLTAR